MGIFGALGKKNVDKVINGAISGIDKLVFSQEERADFNKNVADSVSTFVKNTVDENSTRSITRRFIAFAVMGVYLILVLGSGIAFFFNEKASIFLFELSKSQSTMAIMVAAFYFSGYYVGKAVSLVKNKNKNDKD